MTDDLVKSLPVYAVSRRPLPHGTLLSTGLWGTLQKDREVPVSVRSNICHQDYGGGTFGVDIYPHISVSCTILEVVLEGSVVKG